MKVGLIIVLISYLGKPSETTPTPGSFWPPAQAINAPRDCLWTHWYSNGRCYKIRNLGNNSVYYSSRVRHKIRAKNGGKNCTGDGEEYLPCNELEYIATTFLTTVTAASPQEREVDGFLSQKQNPSHHNRYKSPDYLIVRLHQMESYLPDDVVTQITKGVSWTRFSHCTSAELTLAITPNKTPGDDTVSKKEVTCVKPHRDANGNVRMAGKPCPLGGTKREVDVTDAVWRSGRVDRNTASTKSRDILFLIDESSSVGRSGFSKFLRLAKAVMNSLCGSIRMKKDLTRVGILTFDGTQHPQMNFDDYFERADVIDHVYTNINYTQETSRDTCLAEALSYTREEMLVKKRGARVDIAGTERMVVLLTDGCANCRNQGDLSTALLQMREQFSRDKVPIITFFVGSDSNCVKIMSDLADGSQCYQVFRAMDFDELDAISFAIEQNECVDAWEPGPSCPA